MVRVVRRGGAGRGLYPSRAECRAAAERVMGALGFSGCVLEVLLTGDREIERLNREFLGCEGPTNVLSFPAGAEEVACGGDDSEEGDFGMIALSVETLERECFLYGQGERTHFIRLLAHAILHLAGYDHGPEMEGLTDHVMDVVLAGPEPVDAA